MVVMNIVCQDASYAYVLFTEKTCRGQTWRAQVPVVTVVEVTHELTCELKISDTGNLLPIFLIFHFSRGLIHIRWMDRWREGLKGCT